VPDLWLKASAIRGLVDGNFVQLWPDSSVYSRSVTAIDPLNAPTLTHLTAVLPAVVYDAGHLHQLDLPFELPADYGVYAVALIDFGMGPTDFAGFGALGGVGSVIPLVVGRVYVGRSSSFGVMAPGSAANFGGLNVWAARRVGKTYSQYRGSVHLPDNALDPFEVPLVNGPVGTSESLVPYHTVSLVELRVYNRTVTDACHATVLAELRALYGL
jgi:hypothetical protein